MNQNNKNNYQTNSLYIDVDSQTGITAALNISGTVLNASDTRNISKGGGGLLILGAIVPFLWPEEESSPADVWQSLVKDGEKLANKKISENNKNLVTAQLNSLKRTLDEYTSAVKYWQKNRKNPFAIENVRKKFQFAYNIFINRIPIFKLRGNEILLLPVYAQVANLHLLLIRTSIIYENELGLNEGEINNDYYNNQLEKYIKEHDAYCDKWFKVGLDSVNDIEKYKSIMQIEVLDFITLNKYYNIRNYPPNKHYPQLGGLKSEFTRNIYSLLSNSKPTNYSKLTNKDIYFSLTREPHLFTWFRGFKFGFLDNYTHKNKAHMLYNRIGYSHTFDDNIVYSEIYGDTKKDPYETGFSLTSDYDINTVNIEMYAHEDISAINSMIIKYSNNNNIGATKQLFKMETNKVLYAENHSLPFITDGEGKKIYSHRLSYMKTYAIKHDDVNGKFFRTSALAWTHTSVDAKNTIKADTITQIPAVKAFDIGEGMVIEGLSYTGENLVRLFNSKSFLDMYLYFESKEVEYYMRLSYAANKEATIQIKLRRNTTILNETKTLKKTYFHDNNQNLKYSDFGYSEPFHVKLQESGEHALLMNFNDNRIIINKIEFIPVKVEKWEIPMKRALNEFAKQFPVDGTYISHSVLPFKDILFQNFSAEQYGAQIITQKSENLIDKKHCFNNNLRESTITINGIYKSNSNHIKNWTTHGFKFNKDAIVDFELHLVGHPFKKLSTKYNFSDTSTKENNTQHMYGFPEQTITIPTRSFKEVSIALNTVTVKGTVKLLTKTSGQFETTINYRDNTGVHERNVKDSLYKLATSETNSYLAPNKDGQSVNLIGYGTYEATYATHFTVNVKNPKNAILFKGGDKGDFLASLYISDNKLYAFSSHLKVTGYENQVYFSVKIIDKNSSEDKLKLTVKGGENADVFAFDLDSFQFEDGDILEVYHAESKENLEIIDNYKKLIGSEKTENILYLTENNIVKTGLRFKGFNNNLIATLYIDSNTLYVNSTGVKAHSSYDNQKYFSAKLLSNDGRVKFEATVQGHETANKFASILNGVHFEKGDILEVYHDEPTGGTGRLEVINDYIKTNQVNQTFKIYLSKKGIRFNDLYNNLIADLYIDSNTLYVNSTGVKAHSAFQFNVELLSHFKRSRFKAEVQPGQTADNFASILNGVHFKNGDILKIYSIVPENLEIIDNYKKLSTSYYMEQEIYLFKDWIRFKGLQNKLIAELYIDSNILYVNSTGITAHSVLANDDYFSVRLLKSDGNLRVQATVKGGQTADNFASILNGVHFEDGDILEVYHKEPNEGTDRLEIFSDYNKVSNLEGNYRRIYLDENIRSKGYSFTVTAN